MFGKVNVKLRVEYSVEEIRGKRDISIDSKQLNMHISMHSLATGLETFHRRLLTFNPSARGKSIRSTHGLKNFLSRQPLPLSSSKINFHPSPSSREMFSNVTFPFLLFTFCMINRSAKCYWDLSLLKKIPRLTLLFVLES